MRFYFKLGLVLVTSDCGITAECDVDKSVNTSPAHICAFYETKSLCKNAETVALGKQRINRSRTFKQKFLPTPTTLDQTPSTSAYAGLIVVAVFKISSKYVGILHSLATRRTLGIPKLLKSGPD